MGGDLVDQAPEDKGPWRRRLQSGWDLPIWKKIVAAAAVTATIGGGAIAVVQYAFPADANSADIALSLNRPSAQWEDVTHEGSHWRPALSWSAKGTVTACTVSDGRNRPVQVIDESAAAPWSYPPGV